MQEGSKYCTGIAEETRGAGRPPGPSASHALVEQVAKLSYLHGRKYHMKINKPTA